MRLVIRFKGLVIAQEDLNPKRRYKIGRGALNDIVYSDPQIAEQQADIYFEGNSWWVLEFLPGQNSSLHGLDHTSRIVFDNGLEFVGTNSSEQEEQTMPGLFAAKRPQAEPEHELSLEMTRNEPRLNRRARAALYGMVASFVAMAWLNLGGLNPTKFGQGLASNFPDQGSRLPSSVNGESGNALSGVENTYTPAYFSRVALGSRRLQDCTPELTSSEGIALAGPAQAEISEGTNPHLPLCLTYAFSSALGPDPVVATVQLIVDGEVKPPVQVTLAPRSQESDANLIYAKASEDLAPAVVGESFAFDLGEHFRVASKATSEVRVRVLARGISSNQIIVRVCPKATGCNNQ